MNKAGLLYSLESNFLTFNFGIHQTFTRIISWERESHQFTAIIQRDIHEDREYFISFEVPKWSNYMSSYLILNFYFK
jgi:hypothetical protein